jgi:hypothetical protein
MNATNGYTLDPSTAISITFGIVSAALALFTIIISWHQLKMSALMTFTLPVFWSNVSNQHLYQSL